MDKFPNMDALLINNQAFQLFLTEAEIMARIAQLAQQLNADYSSRKPIFIAVLNGSFMFASDLLKAIQFDCEIQFVKVNSYQGMQSSGKVQELIGLNQNIANRPIIILEDIIDTGLTMHFLITDLLRYEPESLAVCSLLLKPDALKVKLQIDYVGFEVSNQFLVGYGLDYNGLARNLRQIYQAV